MLYIFISVIIFYILVRVLGRFLLPWLIKRYLRRVKDKFFEENPHVSTERFKGDSSIRIDYSGPSSKSKSTSEEVGEYVDYEEQKE